MNRKSILSTRFVYSPEAEVFEEEVDEEVNFKAIELPDPNVFDGSVILEQEKIVV